MEDTFFPDMGLSFGQILIGSRGFSKNKYKFLREIISQKLVVVVVKLNILIFFWILF